MKAYILINVRIGQIKDVIRHLRSIDQVTEATMTFGPYDAVAIVEVKDLNELGSLISNSIHPIPGVLETLTCLAAEV